MLRKLRKALRLCELLDSAIIMDEIWEDDDEDFIKLQSVLERLRSEVEFAESISGKMHYRMMRQLDAWEDAKG